MKTAQLGIELGTRHLRICTRDKEEFLKIKNMNKSQRSWLRIFQRRIRSIFQMGRGIWEKRDYVKY